MKKDISLFVVSDLHAFSAPVKDKSTPSALEVTHGKQLSESDQSNPAASLLRLIKKESITADYVICCGDFTHKANRVGLIAAWAFVLELKAALKAKEIIATVGNHDVSSQAKLSREISHPFDHIKELTPQFPFSDERLFDKYWARNFVLRTTNDTNFLVLNTCSTHGYLSEHIHGRVSEWTLKNIETTLKHAPKRRFNICVCHHHPHKHEELQLGDYDDIKHGQLLLQALEAHGGWLILHGHKHHPKLVYAQGASHSPVVFSAGSFAATFEGEMNGRIRNQCYRIKLHANANQIGSLCGEYMAWTWSHAGEWELRSNYLDLPAHGGFGCRTRAPLVAKTVRLLKQKSIVSWPDLLQAIPQVRFLIPTDIEHFLRELKTKSVRFDRGEDFFPKELQL